MFHASATCRPLDTPPPYSTSAGDRPVREGGLSTISDVKLDDSSILEIDIGRPSRAVPVTPPGIRVPYHGGSIGLSIGGTGERGYTERVEIVIAQCLLDRRVT